MPNIVFTFVTKAVTMKHMSIVVPEGTLILDTVVGSMNLFRMANSYSKKIGRYNEDLFDIDLVSQSMEPITCHTYFQIQPTKTLEKVKDTDVIIITSITGNMDENLNKNTQLIDWIRDHRIRNGTEIVSLCRSAFLLAETGLMNGKSCATHWAVHNQFETRYPKIDLLPEKIVSEDNGIYSSGGAYSFLNMIIYLIEKFYGRETAIWCAKMGEIDFDRINQNQFSIFSGQKGHGDADILKVQDYIEENFEEKITIENLAKFSMMSARTFIRRFKKATKNTPLEYIQRIKIEAAKKYLETTTSNINEVMYQVGYLDEKAFRKIFKKYTGMSPISYRKKYNPEMAYA